ncbi:MAG: TonB-dependent receptor, partial [Desulfobacteraceae bacterium]|nr:TonB-dependent receptor [Desulfobacteraceae bacterium]
NSNTAILDKSYVKTRLYYDVFENSLYSFDDANYKTISKKYAFRSWYDDYTYGGSIEGGTQLLARNFIKASFHYIDDVHREHNEGYPIQHFEDLVYSIGLEDTVDITDKLYSIMGFSYDRLETVEAQNLISGTKNLTNFNTGVSDAFNPQGGLFYKLTETGTVHATFAEKSRLPSMKDKYSYKLGKAIPNPGLQPEESLNYEVGYKDLIFKNITFEANFFYSDVSDFILQKTVPDPSNPKKTVYQNQNIGNVNQYGVELGVSGQILQSLRGGFNYTYIKYENQSSADKLTNIPNHKVFGYLHYFTPVQGLSVLGSVEYNGDRYSSSTGVRVADEFALVNTKAIYEFYKGFTIEAGINNILDENYELDEGYPLEGRNYFMNLRYKF